MFAPLVLVLALGVGGKTPFGPPQRYEVGERVVGIEEQTLTILDGTPGKIVEARRMPGGEWHYVIEHGVWAEQTMPLEDRRIVPEGKWINYLWRWWRRPFLKDGVPLERKWHWYD